MKCKRLAITRIVLLALLLSTGSVIGQEPSPQAEAQSQGDLSLTASVSSRISYQGVLHEDGTPVSGSRDMVFGLFSNDACTTQVGDDMVKNGVTVTDGLFSVELDVNHDDFDGQRLWLEVEVGGTILGCQEILPAPYALSLRPGATIAEDTDNRVELNRHYQPPLTLTQLNTALYAEAVPTFVLPNNLYYGIHALGQNIGVRGESTSSSGKGVYGYATAASGTNRGVYGQSESPDGAGVYGTAPVKGVEGHATYADGVSYGVYGSSDSSTGTGVHGEGDTGVYGTGDSTGIHGYVTGADDPGVYGQNTNTSSGFGVYGDGATGVYGTGDIYGLYGNGVDFGVFGMSALYGVYGSVTSAGGYGVVGQNTNASSGHGVWGDGYTGVYGTGDGFGVWGVATGDTYAGVYGLNHNQSGGHGLYGAGFVGASGDGRHLGIWGLGFTAGGSFQDMDSGIYADIAYDSYGILSNGTIRGSNISSAQPHPTDTTKTIVYGVLEGGEAGTYYRGTAQLEKGVARVELPEHFSLVTEEDGLTVQVTPRRDCNGLYVAEVTTMYIVVRELRGGSSDARFDFFINGVRSGYQEFQVLVDTEELGLDALDDPPELLPLAEESQPPEPAEGAGQPEGGGADE